MPYVPLRSGRDIWISDPDEAKRTYDEEWSEDLAPESSVATQEKPKEKESSLPWVRTDEERESRQAEQKAWQDQSLTDRLLGKNKPRQSWNPMDKDFWPQDMRDPEEIPDWEGEGGRMVAKGIQGVINTAPALLEMGWTIGKEALTDDDEKDAANTVSAVEALLKTGKRPDGFSYGIKPDTPVFGALSEDSELMRNLDPKTWWGELGGSILSAIYGDKGLRQVINPFRGVGIASKGIQTSFGVSQAWARKDVKAGLAGVGAWFLKEAIPEMAQDVWYFGVELPDDLDQKLENIRQLESQEDREIRMKLLLAEDDFEFDLVAEQLKNVVTGLGFFVALKGAFKVANKTLRKTTEGVEPKKALDEAVEEVEPEVKAEVEPTQLDKAAEMREAEIADINVDMSRKIDEYVGRIAYSAREGAKKVITETATIQTRLNEVVDEISEIPDATKIKTQIDDINVELNQLEKKYSVETPEKFKGKFEILVKRVAEYEKQIRKDPNWLKARGKRKNVLLYNDSVRALEALQRIEQLQAVRQGLDTIDLERVSREAEGVKLGTEADVSITGFRNAINDARILLRTLNDLDARRVELLKARNNQLVAEGRLDEVNTDYSFPGALGDIYRKLQELVQTAEIVQATGNLDITKGQTQREFMNEFVQQLDDLHNKSIEAGGMAPVVPEKPQFMQKLGDAADEGKVPLTGDASPLLARAITATNEAALQAAKKGDDVVKDPSELLEGQRFKAPDVLKPRVNKAGDLEVIADGVPTTVDKQTPIAKLLRMAPKGEQAKIAFERLDEAIKKLEKGMNIPMEERTVINTVGDLVNLLNVGRVAGEEVVQKALRDLDKSVQFLAEIRPLAEDAAKRLDASGRETAGQIGKSIKAIPDKIQDATKDVGEKVIKALEDDMIRTDTKKAGEILGKERVKGLPEKSAAIENEVPVKTTEDGKLVIDGDKLASRTAPSLPKSNTPPNPKTIQNKVNKLLKRQMTIDEAEDAIDDITRGMEEVEAKRQNLLLNNPLKVDDANKINNTNALKYATRSAGSADLMTARFKTLNRLKTRPIQYKVALEKLASFIPEQSRALRQLALFAETEAFAKNISENFNLVMATTATVDDVLEVTLRDVRDLRKIFAGQKVTNKSGVVLDKQTALMNFSESFTALDAAMSAVNETFYASGNLLNLLARRNILRFRATDPTELFSEWNKGLLKLGDSPEDYGEAWAANYNKAVADKNKTIGAFFQKVADGAEISATEMDGLERLIDKIYESKGDYAKLKELEVTGDSVLARLQIGSPLSNPAIHFSIPIQGGLEAVGELTGRTVIGHMDAKFAKYILKEAPRAEDSLKEAEQAAATLNNLRHVIGEAFDTAYTRFVYGKSITDATQAADKAWELRKGGLRMREEAILQDLKSDSMQIPFVKYVLNRKDHGKIFETFNKARVLTKVFHDYLAPAEAWQKRGWFGKNVLGGTTTATMGLTGKARKLLGGVDEGFGAKSYYPGGEEVNLSLWGQMAATGDEFNTAFFANASIRGRISRTVDDLISKGEIDKADRTDTINKLYKEKLSSVYAPVKAGYDAETIGHAVLDEQILELTRAVNLTTELTGFSKSIEESINALRKSKHPGLRIFGRDIFPFLVSPINGIKRAVRLAYGLEIGQAGLDLLKIGVKKSFYDEAFITGNSVGKAIDNVVSKFGGDSAKWRQSIIDFESKYTSSDPKVRIKAQGALALATGIQGIAWFLTHDGNQDITGDQQYTYKYARGVRKPYTWLINGKEIPYRYIPLLGQTLAFHANLRDLTQFGSTKADDGPATLAIAATAITILDTPAMVGFDKVQKALAAATTGNTEPLERMVSESVNKVGDPHTGLRKFVWEGFDPSKPSDPGSKFGAGYTVPKRLWERGDNVNEPKGNLLGDAANLFGRAYEYNLPALIADGLIAASDSLETGDGFFKTYGKNRLRSRQAIWWGKPGQTVEANHSGFFYPLQAVLGRYWAFPSGTEDPVGREMLTNLIPPANHSLYRSKTLGGVVMSDRVLNDFNHFLNTEFTTYSRGKEYVGANSYFKSVINDPNYKNAGPGLDSPSKIGPVLGINQSVNADWDTENNMRRIILKNERDRIIELAREQWLIRSENPEDLQFPMPADMRELILKNRLELDGGVE